MWGLREGKRQGYLEVCMYVCMYLFILEIESASGGEGQRKREKILSRFRAQCRA